MLFLRERVEVRVVILPDSCVFVLQLVRGTLKVVGQCVLFFIDEVLTRDVVVVFGVAHGNLMEVGQNLPVAGEVVPETSIDTGCRGTVTGDKNTPPCGIIE